MPRVTIGHPDGDSPIWPHGRTIRSMLLQMGLDSLLAMSRRNHASRVTGLADVTCSGSLRVVAVFVLFGLRRDGAREVPPCEKRSSPVLCDRAEPSREAS